MDAEHLREHQPGGLTLLLVSIGQAVARRGGLGFGMRVIHHNRSRLDEGTERELKAT